MSNISSTTESQIHIALSPWDLTDDYNRHAGVTMLSALEHCSQIVTIHLLYDSKLSVGKEREERNNKSYYQQIAERYDCELKYHHVELPDWISNVPGVKKWTPGSLMRLYLPDLLPNIEKILYLDCDMVINTDLKELWTTPLGDEYLAAVPDSTRFGFERKRERYYRLKNIPQEDYFCSGILLLNLRKLRDRNHPLSQTTLSYLQENKDMPFPDQDLLNWYCEGQYLKLDSKYNILSDRIDATNYIDDGVIHYAGRYKPWKAYLGDIDDLYWKFLLQTPWCNDKENILRYVRDAPDISKCFTIFPKYVLALRKLGYGNRVKNLITLIIEMIQTLVVEGFDFLKRTI